MTKAQQHNHALGELLALGLQWHTRGDWLNAKAIYEQVLKLEPRHFDALHMLGVLAFQNHKPDQAEALIDKAIQVDPRHAQAYSNRGNALRALGRLEEAVKSYEQAIELNGDYVEAHVNLGNALKDLGQLEAADKAYKEALAINPCFAQAHFNRGVVLESTGSFDEALACYRQALCLHSNYPEAHTNIANLLKKLGQLTEALTHYQEAGRLKPQSAEVLTNWGIVLHDLGRWEDSLDQFDQALKIRQDDAEIYSNRSATLQDLGRAAEALESADLALKLKPDHVQAHTNRGLILSEMHRLDEALIAFDCALQISPGFANANWNKALALLAGQHFDAGWPLMSFRWEAGVTNPMARLSGLPVWKPGMAISRALILAEQGLGDEVLYSKYLPTFLERFGPPACVTLDHRLINLFERSFPGLRFFDRHNLSQLNPSEYGLQLNLGDLPQLLSIDPKQMPSLAEPHLKVDLSRPNSLIGMEGFRRRPIVGISWQSKNAKFGSQKSMSLINMMRDLKDIDATWINLQYGDVSEEIAQVQAELGIQVHQVAGLDVTNDLDAMFKLIHDCDFVITTSNSTAHFCGSIGHSAIVLVPHGKGWLWYWHLDDGPSIWYPSLHIIHCKEINGWTQALSQAKQVFKELHGSTH